MDWFAKAVAALLLCGAVAFGISAILSDAPMEEQPTEMPHSSTLVLDMSNAALMHKHGMPTAEDVMYYHLHGQWAYYQDGVQVTLDRLPGDSRTWDALYGIDSDNPAFDK